MKQTTPVRQRAQWLAKTLSVLETEWHTKRVSCFGRVVEGLVACGRMGIASIGRSLPGATTDKHRIKAVDRFLRSDVELLPLWQYLLSMCTAARGRRIELALDWTDLGGPAEALVVAAAHDGRGLPVAWMTFLKGEYARSRNAVETTLCRVVKSLCDGLPPVLLMDRGFARSSLFKALQTSKIPFIVRIKRGAYIADKRGERQLKKVSICRGQVRDLGTVELGIDAKVPIRIVMAWGHGGGRNHAKEPWCLATNLSPAEYSGTQIAEAYGRRFAIEQNFRDHKSMRFGFQMRAVRIKSPERWDRMLAIAAMASWVLTAVGRFVEREKLDTQFRANTAQHRTHSHFFRGLHFVHRLLRWPPIELRIVQIVRPFSPA